jgi:hypothetical protein
MIEQYYKHSKTMEPRGLNTESLRQWYFAEGFSHALENKEPSTPTSDVIKLLEGLNEYVHNNSFGASEFPDDMLMITSKCIKTEITRTINTIQGEDDGK